MAGAIRFDKWIDTKGVTRSAVLQTFTSTTGFVHQTITSSTPVAVTGLSVTITPKFATSKILIQACVHSNLMYVSGWHIYRNGVEIISNHGSNIQTGGSTALYTIYRGPQASNGGDSRADTCHQIPFTYHDSPNTTTSLTYQIYANSGWNGNTNTLYINQRSDLDMLSTSYITVMEIAQ